jgi:hypothetical protein
MSGLLKYADAYRIHVDSISLGQGQVCTPYTIQLLCIQLQTYN